LKENDENPFGEVNIAAAGPWSTVFFQNKTH